MVAVAGVDTRNASLQNVTSRVKGCGDTVELTLEVQTDTVDPDSDAPLNHKKTKRRKKGTAASSGGGGGRGNGTKERLCATPDCGGTLVVGDWFHDGGEAVSVCRSCYTQAVTAEQNRFFEVKDTILFDQLFGASVAAAAMGIVPPTAAAAEAVEAQAARVLKLDGNGNRGGDDSDIDLDELDFGGPSNASPAFPAVLIRPRTSSVMSMDELDFGGEGSTTGTPPSSRRSPASPPMIMVDETGNVGSPSFTPSPGATATTTATATATVTNEHFALDVPAPASHLAGRRPSMDLPRAEVLSAALRVKSPSKRPPSRRRKAPPSALNLAAAVPVGGDLQEEAAASVPPSLDDREASEVQHTTYSKPSF